MSVTRALSQMPMGFSTGHALQTCHFIGYWSPLCQGWRTTMNEQIKIRETSPTIRVGMTFVLLLKWEFEVCKQRSHESYITICLVFVPVYSAPPFESVAEFSDYRNKFFSSIHPNKDYRTPFCQIRRWSDYGCYIVPLTRYVVLLAALKNIDITKQSLPLSLSWGSNCWFLLLLDLFVRITIKLAVPDVELLWDKLGNGFEDCKYLLLPKNR